MAKTVHIHVHKAQDANSEVSQMLMSAQVLCERADEANTPRETLQLIDQALSMLQRAKGLTQRSM